MVRPFPYACAAVQAIVALRGDNNVTGIVNFVQQNAESPIQITGEIHNLAPNIKHGFHVHAFGDLSDGCASTGGHLNPFNKTHGAPDAEARHVGDLGNIEADDKGTAVVNITDDIVSLFGKYSILGRGIVVHAAPDDLGLGGNADSLKTGNAGARAGCGVVGIKAEPAA